jgi:membrane-associated progesterone receptor component
MALVLELWETLKESITAYTGLTPVTFFTVVALGFAVYYTISSIFGSSNDHGQARTREFEEKMEPLPPPVQLGEVTDEELRKYDGSDPKKPLLMAIKGQIYDVSQSRIFYGPGGPYHLFAGKDASRALAKMSFEDKDLNGDLTDLGVFEMEALQDWEYKFMSKYVKVGTVKTVPVTDAAAAAEPAANGETSETVAEASVDDIKKPTETADEDVAKPVENGHEENAAKENDESKPEVVKEE